MIIFLQYNELSISYDAINCLFLTMQSTVYFLRCNQLSVSYDAMNCLFLTMQSTVYFLRCNQLSINIRKTESSSTYDKLLKKHFS